MRGCFLVLSALIGLASVPGARAQAHGAAVVPAAGPAAFEAAFAAAQSQDAEYRGARFELESREQNRPLARSGLLPNVAATYSESRVRGERVSPNALGQDFTQVLDYRNPVGALQLRQPLFNLDAALRYRSALVQIDGARAVFTARGQELLDRLGSAYLQRLFAEEVVALAQAQVQLLQAQTESAEQRFVRGEGTRTEVADVKASLALAQVQAIEAMDQRDLADRALARVTGGGPLPLRSLAEDKLWLPLPADGVQAWIDLALAHSPSLEARRLQLESARQEVQRARAAHLPRVDLVASAIDARNDTLSTLNQRARQYSAGVQITVPIFSGGAVEASVKQARADADRTEADFDNDRAQLVLDVRRQYQAVHSGRLKVDALNEALVASSIGLEGARRGLAAGLRTPADVLDAVRRVFQSRRDLAQARTESLLARLRLQTLSGMAPAEIVADMDRHLSGPLLLPSETPR